MIETRIPIAPDTSTTLTDETTEHIVNRKVTIKIDRDYLKKKYAELYKQLAKLKLSPPVSPTTCKSSLIKQYLQPLTNDIFIHIFLLSYK